MAQLFKIDNEGGPSQPGLWSSGSTLYWNHRTHTANCDVATAAALAGTYGVEVRLSAVRLVSMLDASWGSGDTDIIRHGTRFDPNGATSGVNDVCTIFNGRHNGSPDVEQLITMEMRQASSTPTYEYRAGTKNDSDVIQWSAWSAAQADEPVTLEIEVQNGLSNGAHLKFWVGETLVDTVSGFTRSSALSVVNQFRYGRAFSGDTFSVGNSVNSYFDDTQANDDGSAIFVGGGGGAIAALAANHRRMMDQ